MQATRTAKSLTAAAAFAAALALAPAPAAAEPTWRDCVNLGLNSQAYRLLYSITRQQMFFEMYVDSYHRSSRCMM